MAKFLWLNWSGGGNLPPSLGIARVLTERGHTVAFAGRPEMVPRVEAAGFRAIELTQAYAQADKYPAGPMQRAASYLTSPAVAEQVRDVVTAEAPDLLIFDGMFPAALAQAKDFGKPSVAVSHTFIFRMLERWRGTTGTLIGMRRQAGFGPLPDLDALWQGCDRILATTLAEFDGAAQPGWERVRHVGPVLEDEKVAVPTELPWRSEDNTPLALMSFSTGFEQRSLDKLQRGLDAFADLPLNLVVTTGGIVDPAELKAPRNAFVVNYAAHDPIIARAALVVTHGGHGTAMRALKYGVPMIVMPGLAHDQALIGALMEEWGTGIAMPGDVPFGAEGQAKTLSREAYVEALRKAVEKIITTPSYRVKAKQRAAMLAGVDGAANAAREIEALLT
jgi:UDP:flavonoid glycosyltransferase YjiC (YdhE family)